MYTDIAEGKVSLHGKYWCHQTWQSCVEEGQAAWGPFAPMGGHGSHCHKQTDPQTSLHCLHRPISNDLSECTVSKLPMPE